MSDNPKVIFDITGDDSKLKSVLSGAVTAVGAAAVAAGAAVIKFGTDFETSMAKASTLVDTTQYSMDDLSNKILDVSDKTGVAAEELGEAMYSALSASVPLGEEGADMMMFLEKSAQLAKSGFTDVDTAVSATAKVLNAYKMDVSETDKIHKILMQTQNKGITTVGELGSVLAQVTPTAAAMGVEFEQVGAALAGMTAQGTPTAQATTQLNQLFAELGKSGTTAQKSLEKATQGTKYAGKSFQDLMKEGVPLNEIIGLIAKSAEANGLSLLDMFSSIEAGKAALSMAGDNAQQFTDNLEAMRAETDVVGEAFEKVSETTEESFNRVLNELKNTAISLFQSLLPIIDQALPILGQLVDSLMPPLLQIVEAIMPTLISLFEMLMPVFQTFANEILPIFLEIFEMLLPPLLELVESILPPILEILTILLEPLLQLVEAILPALSVLITSITQLLNFLMPVVTALANALSGVLGNAFKTVSDLVDGAIKVFKGLIDFIVGVFTGDWEKAWNGVVDMFKGIFNMIPAAVEWVVNRVIDFINGLIAAVNAVAGLIGIEIGYIDYVSLPRLQHGEDFVPSDWYPAYLDYGERVLTREQNQKFTSMGGLQGMEAALDGRYGGADAEVVANITLTGSVEMDGFEVGKVVLQNIDDVAAFMLRGR